MKNIRLLLVLTASLLFLSSCTKNDAIFPIDTYLEMTIVAGTSADRVQVLDKEVAFPYSSQLDAFNTSDADVTSINGVYGYVYPKFGVISDLSFINEIEISAINPDDFTEDKEVFYFTQQDFIRNKDIDLFPSLPNAKDYVRNDKLVIRIEVFFNTPPPATFDLAFELEFGAFSEDEP